MKPKKLKLMVVTPYFWPKIGGLENYAYNIAKGLKKDYGYEVVVVTSNHENPKEYKEEILDGMKIYRLPRQFKISNTPISFKWKKQITEIIEKEQPDIINGHSPVPFISDIACRIAYKKKIPFVLTYHAVTLYKKNNPLANILIFLQELFFAKKTLKISSKIIAVSDFVKIQFSKIIQDKTEVIYNGISKEDIKPRLNNFKKNNIIFLSSLDKTHSWKGLEKIIIAVRYYIDNFDKDIQLNIIGDGNYYSYYENLVNKLKIQKNVKFYGAKFGKEKQRILSESKILITYPTTSNDAFPTVFLEAWANNLPIISSRIGAIPYIIKDKQDGILVGPNDSKKLSQAIHDLINDKYLIKKLIKNGRTKVKCFTWDKISNKINKIFRSL